MKTGGKIHLLSGNDKDFSTRYAAIAAALEPLPNETVIDGEVVAMDTSGRPSFKALQNFSAGVPVFYYVFDVLILSGRDVMRDPLEARRELLRKHILPKLDEPIRYSPHFNVGPADLIRWFAHRGSRASSRSGWTAGMNPVSAPVSGGRCGSIRARSS